MTVPEPCLCHSYQRCRQRYHSPRVARRSPAASREEIPLPQERDPRLPVHAPFHQLQPQDLPLDLPAALLRGDYRRFTRYRAMPAVPIYDAYAPAIEAPRPTIQQLVAPAGWHDDRDDGAHAPHPGFSSRNGPMTNASSGEVQKHSIASRGEQTTGSPRVLNEVLTSTGTPVRAWNAMRRS